MFELRTQPEVVQIVFGSAYVRQGDPDDLNLTFSHFSLRTQAGPICQRWFSNVAGLGQGDGGGG